MLRTLLPRVVLCGTVVLLAVEGWTVSRASADEAKKAAPAATKAPGTNGTKTDAAKADAAKPVAATKDAAKKDGGDESAKPARHRVKKGPLRVEVVLDGVFEPQTLCELCLRPQEWVAGLTVLSAAEHGTFVHRGDLLLALDTEKIDRAIADQRSDLQLSDLSLQQAQEQLAALEKSLPLDMESDRRAQRIAQEDLKQFFDVDRPLTLKSVEFMVEQAKDKVGYEEEELRQLEKMYRADDLREETETIVLKRARDTVKDAKFRLERTLAMRDDFLKFGLPRQEEKVKEAAVRADLDWNHSQVNLPLALSKHRLEYEKLKIQRAQTEERLNKLLADRAYMIIKTPVDGVVYHGKFVRGRWSNTGTAGDSLRRGSSILPNDVFMTVVQTRPLQVHANLPENQLQNVHAGLKGCVEPTATPGQRLGVVVSRVSAVPAASGIFDAQFTLSDAPPEMLMPGMGGELRVAAYQKADALTVPLKAVFADEADPLKQVVYLVAKSGPPEKRGVTLGRRDDKQVEILQGLAEGDEVLLERPKE